jgi:hypothetical protein
LRVPTGAAISIRASWPIAHQGPIDAGRGNLEAIGLADRIFEVEHGRERHARPFAVVDGHRAVGPLRHDLQGRSAGRRYFDPHQPKSQIAQDRPDDRADASGAGPVVDETRFVERVAGRPVCGARTGGGMSFGHGSCRQ